MNEQATIEMRLPKGLASTLQGQERFGLTDEERVKIPLAIGLYAERCVTLAKAAALAGMSRYEFSAMLKRIGLPAVDYTETEYNEDKAFLS